jgi:hypothetical protein
MKGKIKMKVKYKIKFHWKCDAGIDIPKGHEEALQDDANKRIFEMIQEGYFQGELSTSIRFGKDIVSEEDEDEGLSYSGWWYLSVKRK